MDFSDTSYPNNFANAQPPQIDLARSRFEGPFFVDMEAFFEFSFWISEELLDLEARFKLKSQREQGQVQPGQRSTCRPGGVRSSAR